MRKLTGLRARLLPVVGLGRIGRLAAEDADPVFYQIAVVLAYFQKFASHFQTQVPAGSRPEAYVRAVDTREILDCLGALYYFQDGGRHIALNREGGLVLPEADVERIHRTVSDEEFMQLEFGHVGHEVEVQMPDRLDIGDDHCPVQIELVEGPVMCHVVGVVLVSGLGIAAYAYLFRKETDEFAVLPVICYGAEGVGGRRGADACSGGQDQGEDGGLEVHGCSVL